MVNKNVKGAKMMELKLVTKYPHKFNFAYLSTFFRVISLCLGGDDKNLGESSGREARVKMTRFNFLTHKCNF